MKLKEFKQALIDYARTLLPSEYAYVLRVPGSATTQDFTLRSTKKEDVKAFCKASFGYDTKSFKISRKESIYGEEILKSFLVALDRENDDIAGIFPDTSEEELLNLEKSRIKNNLEIAFNHPKSEVHSFLKKAEEAGLIKANTMSTKQQTWNDFLEAWPIERVKAMQIEEYTNLERDDSFCYWLEKRTEKLGSIWGGSAYKFGIFKMRNEAPDDRSGYESDGQYKWVGKFGKDRETAFDKIKEELIAVIEASQKDELEVVDQSSLGHMFKWKVAALYNKNIPHIYSPKAVNYLIKFFGKSAKSFPEKYSILAEQKQKEEDIIKLSERLWGIFTENNEDAQEKELGEVKSSKYLSLNRILYGPPGTGKTYNTINEAIKIVSPEFYQKHYDDRDKLKEEFERLLIKDWDETNGKIAFCTFHQSYSYEDFVEGIKPKTTDDDNKRVFYEIEGGIFKKLCRLSRDSKKSKQIRRDKPVTIKRDDFKNEQFFKISLGDSSKTEDQVIFEYCIRNNVIALGYGDQIDFSNLNEQEIIEKVKESELTPYSAQALNTFIHILKKGNYVLVSNGNKYFRALGRVIGGYEFKKDSPIQYNHFRTVEWIYVGEDIPVGEVYEMSFQMQPIYKLDNASIKKEFFLDSDSLTKVMTETTSEDEKENRYVLIIDEINRGNVSSIFGELITLLEEDKRTDGDEPLEVILPYSKEPFQVPSNIYVLGTMNTADRSVEALDTALRRRFSFDEMPPDYDVLTDDEIDGIDLRKLLRTINERIELLIDSDHKIGHSYFINLKTLDDLKTAFENKVIPLLQEYFFGDIAKIGLVLGSGFIEKINGHTKLFDFKDYDVDIREELSEKSIFKLVSSKRWDKESFVSIYKQ